MDEGQDRWTPCFNPQKTAEEMLAEIDEFWIKSIAEFKRQGLITDEDLEMAKARRRRRKASRKNSPDS
ncbi:MAG: hypothetical protein L0338_36090 [Acidobacteria bacterium]|nr:hypothetical protein [Acidobacteriota bacterium]